MRQRISGIQPILRQSVQKVTNSILFIKLNTNKTQNTNFNTQQFKETRAAHPHPRQRSSESERLEHKVWEMRLSLPPPSSSWTRIPPYPQPSSLFPLHG